MAGYDISVGIGVEGESKFSAALKECQNSVKQLDSALKANAAEYEANADALGENVEKTRLLKESIALQKSMVQGLSSAIEYANKEYGEASAQTTKYVLAQNKAREAVAKMEKELKDADRGMEELGRDSIRVGRQLENGIGDGAEDAAKKLSQMMDDIKGELSSIGGAVGVTATIDVIKSVGEGIENISEQTQEYRRTVSYLEQNTKDAGQAWADIEQHLFRVTANTGNLEGASEGLSNLLAAGLDSKEVADSVTLLLGAITKFPDTYNFESLAESLRNTIEEKQAVGQFGELLQGMGVDLDTFNKALEKTTSKEAAQDLVLSFGANRGLEKTIAEYEAANEQMLAANTATLQYKASLSELAGQMSPIGEAYTKMGTAVVSAISKLFEATPVDEWAVAVLQTITATVQAIEDIITGEAFKEEREKNAEIAGIIEERTGYYSDIEALNRAIAESDAQGDYSKSYELEQERARILKQIAEEAAKIEADTGKTEGETVGGNVTTGMETAIEEGAPGVATSAQKMVKEVENEIETGGNEMETLMDNALIELSNAFGESTPGMTAAVQGFVNAVNKGLEGIVFPDIAATAQEQINGLNRAINSKPVYDGSTYTPSAGGRQNDNKTMHMSFNVNGRAFAEATIDDYNAVQGMAVSRGISLNA